MKKSTLFVMFFLVASPGLAITTTEPETPQPTLTDRLLNLSQSYSCTPRRYCSRNISTCREARWYFQNCSWGGALDGDNDGIPCENLC